MDAAFDGFWHPVLPASELGSEPSEVILLGRSIVIWRVDDELVAALENRCRHRSAKLSLGCVSPKGWIRCPYHGWAYDYSGACRNIPQEPGMHIPDHFALRRFHAQAKYGMVWIALAKSPLIPIPELPRGVDLLKWRGQYFKEEWNCSPLRALENGIDSYHHFFVHRKSLKIALPISSGIVGGIKSRGYGFCFDSPLTLSGDEILRLANQSNTLVKVARRITWLPPFALTIELNWPGGEHQCIAWFICPQGDQRCTVMRFYLTNQGEADVASASIFSLDQKLMEEDRKILESLADQVEIFPRDEVSLSVDQPIVAMRQRLKELLDSS